METTLRFRSYRTITREDVKFYRGKFDYDIKMARWLLQQHPAAARVIFARPRDNDRATRYVPPDRDTIIYVKASSGTWGKPARTYLP